MAKVSTPCGKNAPLNTITVNITVHGVAIDFLLFKIFLIAFFGMKNKSIEYLNLDYSRVEVAAKARKWPTKL
jgi:hypothetical protein